MDRACRVAGWAGLDLRRAEEAPGLSRVPAPSALVQAEWIFPQAALPEAWHRHGASAVAHLCLRCWESRTSCLLLEAWCRRAATCLRPSRRGWPVRAG